MKKNHGVKEKWLNVMLHFSAFINSYKLKLVDTNGPKIILYGFFILLLELSNFFISLPAYAFIKPEFFAGGDQNAIKTYRLRRIISLSVLGGMVLAFILWVVIAFFSVTLFPGSSYASTASWDFNNSLAYHYDPTKIQIVDGTVVFKANQTTVEVPVNTPVNTIAPPVSAPDTSSTTVTPTTPDAPPVPPISTPVTPTPPAPVIESAPAPAPEPVSVPAPTPAPVAPSSPLIFNYLKSLFAPSIAFAQGNSCSATLEPIAPLVVASFDHWTSFSEIANKNGGDIAYQLSTDGGITWQYFNGSAWANASTNDYNTANDINNHITSLPTSLSVGGVATLSFRARFTSDCAHDVTLLSLTADYAEHTTIASIVIPGNTNPVQTTTSEQNPSVIAVTDSIASTTTNTTSSTSVEAPSIPITPSVVDTSTTTITNTTSVDTGTNVQAPTTDTNSVDVNQNTSLTTNTTVTTPVAVPIQFSVHTVIKTTGTPGHALYSVPGLFSLEEGPDNGLVVKVTNTSLEQTTLTTSGGASGNVSVGDHIVVLTYDGSNLKLYVDGSVSATLNAPIVIAPPAQVSTSIGCVSAGVVLEALSLAQINANYIECGNHAPVINITNASEKHDDNFVDINYTVTDPENNFVTLTKYEYSRTGAFAGEEEIMTEAALDTDSSGTGGLSGSRSGTPHTFVWDVKADLPNTSSNVYVRLKGTDGLIGSMNETFGPFRIDTKAPVVTLVGGTQQSGGDAVQITYKVADASAPVHVSFELSNDNGLTWIVPTTGATGDLGEVTNADGVTAHTISWNAGTNLPAFEGNVKARITATDTFGNRSVTEGASIAVDTRIPFGLANFEGISSNENDILWHWSPAGGELHFSRYVITYGTNLAEVTVGTGASVYAWGPLRDSDMSIIGTDRTVITGLTASTRYYAKMTAYDDFGHEATSPVAFFNTKTHVTTENNLVPISTSVDTNTNVNNGTTTIVAGEEITLTLPDTSTLPLTTPLGGFKIKINGGNVTTDSRNVTLTLTGGDDTALMAISNHADLGDAALVAYASTSPWNLCEGLDTCENATHTVYVKYYTSFGVGNNTSRVSDSIALLLPVLPVVPSNIVTPQINTSEGSTSATVGTDGIATNTEITTGTSTGSGIGGIISSIISDIFGGGNTVETTVPDTTVTVNASPVSSSASSGGGSVSMGGGSGGSVAVPVVRSAPEGVIVTTVVPTTATVAFTDTTVRTLSEARESAVIVKPVISTVNKSVAGGSITFTGKGIPGSKVALFIHSDQVVVYTTDVDSKGEWNYKHDQQNVELAPGEHSVFAVTYDPGSKVKSKPSLVETFEVKQNMAAVVLSYVDLPTTLLTVLACIFGALYIGTRKRKTVQ